MTYFIVPLGIAEIVVLLLMLARLIDTREAEVDTDVAL